MRRRFRRQIRDPRRKDATACSRSSATSWTHSSRRDRQPDLPRGHSASAGTRTLVMFDLRRDTSWHDKIAVRDVTHAGRRIRIFGC